MNKIILVDTDDREIGVAEKLEAHEKALCHRAFSVFVFRDQNDRRELLLQQRHPDKYHCGGLWTNTCCSHPQLGETVVGAGQRRLFEEMGFELSLTAVGRFHYIAKFDNGLTENEVDHVLIGFYDEQAINPNNDEVSAYEWVGIDCLMALLESEPEKYTPWFKQALKIALKGINI